MFRAVLSLLCVSTLAMFAARPGPAASPLLQRPWYELTSPNFRVFSCARTQDVVTLTTKLEQFRATYSSLAGTQAVVSPPVIVMVFPDQFSMRPYLPLYGGTPANVKALFVPASDENWMVTSLSAESRQSPESLYHEYAHLLFRRNNRLWPLWLQEGMAEIYSTFQFLGSKGRFALPQTDHVLLLRRDGLMSISELVSVGRESATYNERHQQGRFYAQSWLLAHFLIVNENPALRSGFQSYTARLRNGEEPLQALTNALRVTEAALQKGLQSYMMRPTMRNIEVPIDKQPPVVSPSVARPLTKAEIVLRLGNQLTRVQRLDEAEEYFAYAKELAPQNPVLFESLGLLADEKNELEKAAGYLEKAIQLKSNSFLVQYLYGKVKLRALVEAKRGTREDTKPIRAALQRSVEMMPSFGPSHHLLGVLEMVADGNPARAEQHVRRALEFEPDNPIFSLTLARIQLTRSDKAGARETLKTVMRAAVEEKLRASAQDLLGRIE